MKRKFAFMITALFLGGCASGPELLPLVTGVTTPLVTEDIFVATARAPSDDPLVVYSGSRSDVLGFAEITVSVPPEREAGTLPMPSRKPDFSRQFAAVAVDRDLSAPGFVSRLDDRLLEFAPGERVAFVFVHGFNTDFAEGVYRQAQFLHDYKIDAAAVNFSWPSAGKTPLYLYDRDSAQFARGGLVKTLRLLAGSKADRIIILGHSMGALLTMEALQEISISGDKALLRRIDAVLLAAPDIDVDVFWQQVSEIDPMPKSFAVMVSSKDRALDLSNRVRGGHPRVGEGVDIDALRQNGIAVIDLSEQGAGRRSLNHSTFASSPALIALAQSGLLGRDSLNSETPVDTALGNLSDLLAGVVYLPAKAAGVR